MRFAVKVRKPLRIWAIEGLVWAACGLLVLVVLAVTLGMAAAPLVLAGWLLGLGS